MSVSALPDNLSHFIRVYENALDDSWCRRLVNAYHALEAQQQRNGRELRAGLEESAWTELNLTRHSDDVVRLYFRRTVDAAVARYNADVGLTIPVPNTTVTANLILKRYRPQSDERFQLHFDSINHLSNRYLVLLWYLNDVADGGATRFPQLDVDVAARAGRLLMFPPYWMYQHEGLAPRSGEKFILSTYLLFDTPTAS
jgi:prolyl 4-hydroxylase